MKLIMTRALALSLPALALTLSAAPAHAYTLPGVTLKAAFAGDNGCVNVSSYGGVVNNCDHAVQLQASIPASDNNWHPTSVAIFGNNSWCQTVTINAVGNGAQVGNTVYTSAGPANWQTLDLGSRFVWPNTGITFRCGLEPNGQIGNFTAQ
jgi:hypothetical protein